MNNILPYYSPALTGGGISDNIFKDMMAEMQGQIPGMPPGAMEALAAGGGGGGGGGPAPGNKKKEKKKGKA